MSALRLERVRHRTVLPAGASPRLRRTGEAVWSRLAGALPGALDEATLPASALVCVRSLTVRLRVADHALADHAGLARLWSDELLRSVREALAAADGAPPGGSPRSSSDELVVVYRSRAAALADLVDRASAGDLARRWAWEQVGLCPVGRDDDPAELVATACELEPRFAGAVLAAAARAGDLHRLGWSWATWERVAAAATGRRVVGPVREPLALRPAVAPVAEPPATADAVRAAVRDSAYRRSIRDTVVREGAPTAAQADAVARLVLREGGHPAPASVEVELAAALLFTVPAILAAPAPARPRTTGAAADQVHPLARRTGGRSGDAAQADPLGPGPASTVAEDPTADQPDRARPAEPLLTSSAGLLFLLHLDALDDALLAAAEHERGLRWYLAALAGRLTGSGPTDPAARLFAGLPLEGELDRVATEPPRPEHEPQLAAAVSAFDAELAHRLPEPDRPQEPAELRRATVRRQARLEADPGWVEVVLGLDAVDVEVRRAGLDLDPGWVPHLGCVVRFRYE